MTPHIETLVDLLQTRAETHPNQLVYTYLEDGEIEGGMLTYGRLHTLASAIAAQLIALNAQNERAVLLYQPGLDYIVAFFGCLYAGVTAVPAYPPHPRRPMTRIKAILDDAQAQFALTTADSLDKLRSRFAEEPTFASLTWLATDTIDPALTETWQKPDVIGPDTLAFLQYTSGSTSTPKGVMISHRNLLSTITDMHRPWNHTPDSVMITWLPIFHDLGLIYGILTPVYGRYHCVLMDPVAFLQRPVRWLQAISHYRGTHSHAPNFAYELCLEKVSDAERDALDLSSWQVTLNAAEPVRLETMQKFAQRFAPCGFRYPVFCPGYGLAEASLKVTAQPIDLLPVSRCLQTAALEQHQLVDADDGVNIVGCGRSEIGADIRIVDPHTCLPCPPDRVGEIWVRSRSVAQGYWQRPEATAATFAAHLADSDEGPFMRTGDLGFLWQGELFITGRIKDLLIIRGRNIYPQDVELVVEQAHEALRPGCGAAFSITRHNVEQLVVVQEVKRTHLRSLTVDEVITAVRRAIHHEFDIQPYAILLLQTGAVQKTSSGKIQRQGNRAAYLAHELPILAEWHAPEPATPHTLPAANGMPSATQLINWLCHWVAQKLDVPIATIQPTLAFADVGLDSVMAVELAQDLADWLPPSVDVELDSTLVWNYPTIAAVADFVQGKHTSPAPAPQNLDDLSEAELVALLAAETEHARRP